MSRRSTAGADASRHDDRAARSRLRRRRGGRRRRHDRLRDPDRARRALSPHLPRFAVPNDCDFSRRSGRLFWPFSRPPAGSPCSPAAPSPACSRRPFTPALILRQIVYIGYFSLPVVGLTALFTGMVLALQSYTGFSRFNAESAVATVVVLSVTRELGPVIAGLMVAGRVGAAMAAEIGTMRVTEQIDALTTLSTDPLRYLVLPRLLAGSDHPALSGSRRRHHRRVRRISRRRLQARTSTRSPT